MSGKSLTLAIGLLALAGCAPPPPPPVVVETAPPRVAVIPAVAPVVLVSEPPVIVHRRAASTAHPAVHHAVHRSYAIHVARYTPMPTGCGTTANPCNVEHKTLPVK